MKLDMYITRAWVLPVVLLAAPLLVAAIALGALGADTKATGVAGLLLLAVVMVAGTVVRRRGRALQHRAWVVAGGAPTTRVLRHRGSTPADALGRRHARLADLTGTAAPTADDEAKDPAAADRIYSEWVDELIRATRDDRVVHNEVTQYGFLRNSAAIRPWGLAIATAVTGASIVVLIATGAVGAIVPAVAGIVMVGVWWTLLTESAAEQQSEIYADALIRATPATPARAAA